MGVSRLLCSIIWVSYTNHFQHEESNSVGSYKDSETSSIHGSELFVPWSWKRLEILEKFTTSEKLSITLEGVSKFSFKAGSAVEEKIARRLDQLDEMGTFIFRPNVF